MLKIAIITGSTRPGRNNEQVARWVLAQAQARGDAEYSLLDIQDFHLPLLDEPLPAGYNQYQKEHTRAWSQAVAPFDGYIIVTPEYNHGPSAAIKNALDYLAVEWANKAMGFVGYGSAGGVRAVEQLRQVVGELQLADVRTQVQLSLFTDFENFTVFKPQDMKGEDLNAMLDQLLAWAGALQPLRAGAQTTEAASAEAEALQNA